MLKYKLSHLNISGLIFIALVLTVAACELEDPEVEILAEHIISLSSNVDSLEADSENTFILTAELQELTDPNKDVTFRTSYGIFTNGDEPGTQETTVRSSGRIAKAELRVNKDVESRIFVSATIDEYASNKELKTVPAYPTSIRLIPDDLIVNKNRGNIVTVDVELDRDQGEVSNNIPVSFAFDDLYDKDLLLLFNTLEFTNDGRCSITIQSLNDSIGPFLFRALVPSKELGDSLIYELNDMRVE